MNTPSCEYGVNDNSYKMAGELAGLTQLVDDFYQIMDELPEAQTIRKMHPDDLTESRQKLAYFLSGWLGGPKLYSQNYGTIRIPHAHSHLPIVAEDSEMWILCMQKAVEKQPYEETFKVYLIEQLRVPAGRITQACRR
ncbi:group II truncated hemoglobin [uncultured Neptuniibacter sp.]|uniref:group II truncated hemoglobin n=1 Tax=uncultured Neptuniibacter sp. TaxID=502143 RepID=UPI002635BA22|nr:group II truncated hemoglobin [uncultured Neptuniibacter sp.]